MAEFSNLNDLELRSLIKRAEDELEQRKAHARERLKEEIQEKLKATGLDLGDLFPEVSGKARKGNGAAEGSEKPPVKPKYRDPVSLETWSGRGARPPLWVKRIMAERGWYLEDFKKSGGYEA